MVDVPYGRSARHRLDLFLPRGKPEGLVVFIHGGYWVALDKSYWSHLAAGPIARGFAVAVPSYTLCPDISIAGICREIGAAVSHAAGMIEGPLYLSGHSAGGHLATRMISATTPLPKGSVSDGPCPICSFETSPPHDGRKHRSQGDKKKAFTTTELKDLGLAKA